MIWLQYNIDNSMSDIKLKHRDTELSGHTTDDDSLQNRHNKIVPGPVSSKSFSHTTTTTTMPLTSPPNDDVYIWLLLFFYP